MGENIIIDFNAFHQFNHLRLLICYTGHFDENKTVEFVSVAICVRSCRLNTVLLTCLVTWQSSKCATFISYSRISYFRHACPKLNLVLISRLTGKRATQNVKKTLAYGHVDILLTYQEAKIKMMILF